MEDIVIEKCAFVTYISSSNFLDCVQTLASSVSLQSRHSRYPFYIALTEDIELLRRVQIERELTANGLKVLQIPKVENPNAHVRIQHFRSNYGILQLWNLTQFDKVVAIDADMVALQSIDELCDVRISSTQIAAANNWWTSTGSWDEEVFNGGLLVFRPRTVTYKRLVKSSKSFKSPSGGVQPFLNHFFKGKWVQLDAKVWGMNANAFTLRPETWNLSNIRMIHYTTKAKPCHTSPGQFVRHRSDHPYVLWHKAHRKRRELDDKNGLMVSNRVAEQQTESRRGCILYLLTKESGPTGKDYLNLIRQSIISVEKFFFSIARYHICILHTGDVSSEDLMSLTTLTSSVVYTYRIKFEFPLHKKEKYSSVTPEAPSCVSKFNPNKVWHVNYLHMCHFYSTDIFHHPVFSEFEWIFRLDADSGLSDFIPCDPFKLLEKRAKVFGYYKKEKQGGGCADGFHDRVMSEYVNKFKISLKQYVAPKDVYLGAFHIFRTSFFRNQSLLEFWDWVDFTAAAYETRTGEQAVVPYALAIQAEASELHQFSGYSLWHRHQNNHLWAERRYLPTEC